MENEVLKGKKVSKDFSNEVSNYWVNKQEYQVFKCPNVSLFRFIGFSYGLLKDRNVLEIGFGHGADLQECAKRGAKVWGLDLNPTYVNAVRHELNLQVEVHRAGVDNIPFKVDGGFDLIYTRDMIYYLTDNQIEHFFLQCHSALNNSGSLIIQFIETDIEKKEKEKSASENFDIDFLKNYTFSRVHTEDNPIRFLLADDLISAAKDQSFSLVGSKRMIQSYGNNEDLFRVDRYLHFKKL